MKRCILLLVLCLAGGIAGAQTASDSLVWAGVEWQRTDLGQGCSAACAQFPIWDSMQSISIVRYPARRMRTALVHAPGPEAATTDSLARREGARFALNGSYFNMRRLIPHTFFSLGHQIVGQTPATELGRSNGVLALRGRRGHRMEILPYDSTQVETYRRRYYAALASGPILLRNGEVPAFPKEVSFYEMRHPRSFMGWDRHGMVYLVVVDGRFRGQADGMSIPELAVVARLLGLEEAINLDGGGSSTLWTDRTGVLNHPFDNRVFDHAGTRVVPNILIVW